jgi:hypothetical protein
MPELVVMAIGAFLLGYMRGERVGKRLGLHLGYQRGRLHGWNLHMKAVESRKVTALRARA